VSVTLLIELAMLGAGLVILLRGRLRLGKRLNIAGWRARAVGLSLLLPLPLTILLAFAIAALINQNIAGPRIVLIGNNVETGLVIGGLTAAVVFATLPRTRDERRGA
jgi:hypothetical protein